MPTAPLPCAARAEGRCGRLLPALALWPVLALLLCVLPAAAVAAEPLTPAQRGWLAGQAVRFGPESDYPPFIFRHPDGRLDGLSLQMLRAVQRHTGLVLREEPAQALAPLLQAARERRVDLLSSLRPTPERAAYLRFSQPYVTVPAVLLRRPSDAAQPLQALAGQKVAIGQGYAAEAVLRQRHPAVLWQALPDDGQVLAALAGGQVQAAVADVASATHLRRNRPALAALRVDGPVGFDYTLSFAVRSDWPELVEIVDRGLRALPQHERQALLDHWLGAEVRAQTPAHAPWATRLALLLLALALGLAGRGLWRRGRTNGRVPS